jgi:DNA-binding LytR/AlgR family response regulator
LYVIINKKEQLSTGFNRQATKRRLVMIQIAVVEDEKYYGRLFKRYINKYGQENGIRFNVHYFEDGEDIVDNYKGIYDIILMDIFMQFMDGITAAEKIRKMDSQVLLIFISSSPQYAMKGYGVDALDYVLKPINYYSFSRLMDRAIGKLGKSKEKYLSISGKGSIKKISLSSILYVEVQDHNLFYHTSEGVFSQRGTMKEVETALEKDSFFRCNKCYLVNLEHVKRFEGSNVIVGDDEVQVSRTRKKEILTALNNMQIT